MNRLIIDNLKKLRKINGDSQKSLAEKIGVDKSTISNYEKGKRTPQKDVLENIANLYKVKVNTIKTQNIDMYIYLNKIYDNKIKALNILETVFPIISPKVRLVDELFYKAYKKQKNLIKLVKDSNVEVYEEYIDNEVNDIYELYCTSYEEHKTIESIINIIPIEFIYACDANIIDWIDWNFMKNVRNSKKKYFFDICDEDIEKDEKENYREHINNLEKLLNKCYKYYPELIDYYNILRYLYGITPYKISRRTSQKFATIYLMNLVELGNSYAKRFNELCSELIDN